MKASSGLSSEGVTMRTLVRLLVLVDRRRSYAFKDDILRLAMMSNDRWTKESVSFVKLNPDE